MVSLPSTGSVGWDGTVQNVVNSLVVQGQAALGSNTSLGTSFATLWSVSFTVPAGQTVTLMALAHVTFSMNSSVGNCSFRLVDDNNSILAECTASCPTDAFGRGCVSLVGVISRSGSVTINVQGLYTSNGGGGPSASVYGGSTSATQLSNLVVHG